MKENGLRITQFTAENFKRLKVVEITPDKDNNLVVISGRNEAGKSSILDAIYATLGGKDAVPEDAVRHGAKSARTKLNLGDMVVERKFSADNSYLKITAKDGSEVKGPQQLLDKLVGRLSFDPLEFVNLKGDEQQKILRKLTGLDFTELEKEKERIYVERTATNRELTTAKARLSNIPEVKALDKEVSVVELTADLQKANAEKRSNDGIRKNLTDSLGLQESLVDRKTTLTDELASIQKQIAELDTRLDNGHAVIEKLTTQVTALVEPDIAAIEQAIADSELTNRLVRQKKERDGLVEQVATLTKETEKATRTIEGIDADKERMIAEAPMPIKGLAFDESGITFKTVPFKQISSSEKLRVGLAISIALNPQVRVILVRDASLLDSANLALLKDVADKESYQIWLEKVDESGKIGVVIEDGSIVETKTEEPK
jgi:DNA repair exonuclease SbcCD ATPase subunit